MADEFPRVEVIAIDLAPLQPRYSEVSRLAPLWTYALCLDLFLRIARKSKLKRFVLMVLLLYWTVVQLRAL